MRHRKVRAPRCALRRENTSYLRLSEMIERAPLRVPATASALALVLAVCASTDAGAQTAKPSDRQDETLEEVVVTGIRGSLESAQEIKRLSIQVVDSIVADDIGKLPDRSVTEALQRVPGVTIDHFMARNDPDHFSVEGSGVSIRGLTFIRSELNGRDVFTANGGRTLSFEDVPPELLGGVDVYKTPSADLIEGGVGGLVNLRTRMPFDSPERIISSSLQYTYGDLREDGKPSASLLYSDRWDSDLGEFGLLVDVAYSEQATRTDGIQVEPYYPRTDLEEGRTVYMPKGANWRTLLFERKRLGTYLGAQWSPSETSELSLQFFRSQYRMHWDENAIFSQTNPYTVMPAPGTRFTYDDRGVFLSGQQVNNPTENGMPFNDDVRSADRRSVTTDISLAGKWDLTDRLSVRSEVQYVRGTTEGFDSTVATGVNIPSMQLDLTGSLPRISVPQEFMANPDNYYWAFTMDKLDDNEGAEKSWRGDLEFSFGGDFLQSMQVGLRYADRDVQNKNSPYNWQAVSQAWMLPGYLRRLASLQDFYPEASSLHTFPNFYRGSVQLPSAVVFPNVSQATGYPNTYEALQTIRQELCKEVDPNCIWDWQPAQFGPEQINNQQEKTYATYAMVNFDSDDFVVPYSGNIGVRVVRTEGVADGNIVFPVPLNIPPDQNQNSYPTFNGNTIPIAVENTYTHVLPAFNFTAKFTPELQGRLGVSKAIVRPDFTQNQAFTQLSASIDQNTGVLSLTSGTNTNPYLRPMRANQFDATLEWYFQHAGSLTGALFYKQLDDVVRTSVFTEQYDGLTFSVTRPQNVGKGTVKGGELAWQQFFGFLPGIWSGLGAAVNYTYVYSSSSASSGLIEGTDAFVSANGVDTDGTIFGALPIEGLSKHSYNIAAFYERGPVQLRLAYNWRSKYLLAVNVNGTKGTDGTPLNPDGVQCGTSPADHCVAWGLPTYNDDYGQLDGSFFYKLTEGISLGIEAQNLTDAENRVLMQQNGPGMQTRGWFISDRRYTAQVRAAF